MHVLHLRLIRVPPLGQSRARPHPERHRPVRVDDRTGITDDRDDLELRKRLGQGPPPQQVIGRLLAVEGGIAGQIDERWRRTARRAARTSRPGAGRWPPHPGPAHAMCRGRRTCRSRSEASRRPAGTFVGRRARWRSATKKWVSGGTRTPGSSLRQTLDQRGTGSRRSDDDERRKGSGLALLLRDAHVRPTAVRRGRSVRTRCQSAAGSRRERSERRKACRAVRRSPTVSANPPARFQ